VDARENIEISNLTLQLIFSIFVFCLTFNTISLSSLHTFFSPDLNQKGKISKTLFSLVDLSDILSHSHSVLSLVDHSPPPAQPHATTWGDPTDSFSSASDLRRPQVLSLYVSLTLSLLCWSLSLYKFMGSLWIWFMCFSSLEKCFFFLNFYGIWMLYLSRRETHQASTKAGQMVLQNHESGMADREMEIEGEGEILGGSAVVGRAPTPEVTAGADDAKDGFFGTFSGGQTVGIRFF
jgi:hypothetical protein